MCVYVLAIDVRFLACPDADSVATAVAAAAAAAAPAAVAAVAPAAAVVTTKSGRRPTKKSHHFFLTRQVYDEPFAASWLATAGSGGCVL